MTVFNYPVGYYKFHKTKIINYQLNRWFSFGYIRKEDCIEAAENIKNLDDFKLAMINQGEKALKEGRTINATFCFRAAEFFVPPSDPDKEIIYDKFIELFYNVAFKDEPLEKHKIPYKNSYLPALKIPSQEGIPKGTLIIHGGMDSFKEEAYSWAHYFINRGYETIIYEGPGQGEALIKSHLPLTYKWEDPTKAVLDHFNLDDVTILGFSMGGWLCFRAAAFEPRIKRVIASSVVFDYLQIPPLPLKKFVEFLFRYPKLMDAISSLQVKLSAQERWGLNNLMYITKKETPTEAALELIKLNEENLESEKVVQDVLILTGEEDHFIPLKMHHKQVAALKNANSVAERIFTRKENAQNHCQVGNVRLALEEMLSWVESIT
jgi:alpha-beta hydrolase superfamily lysophospholipase